MISMTNDHKHNGTAIGTLLNGAKFPEKKVQRLMTSKDVEKDVNDATLLLNDMKQVEKDPDGAVHTLFNVAQYTIGDMRFLPLFKGMVTKLTDKAGATGYEVIQKLDDRISVGGYAAQNDITSNLVKSGIFGTDSVQFIKNYKTVSSYLANTVKQNNDIIKTDYENSIDELISRNVKALEQGELKTSSGLIASISENDIKAVHSESYKSKLAL